MNSKNKFSKYQLLSWLPVLAVMPFLFLFLYTTFNRLTVPFELEWNEGHSAELAVRFAEGLSLYPNKEEGWVPYIYAPGYHQLYGSLMTITNIKTLSLGRLISLLATVASLLIMIEWITHWSKRIEAGLLAAFLYLSSFEPSGFFLDLARNDSMTWFLALLGVSQVFRKESKSWNYWLGFSALLLGTWTKQPVLALWIICILWVMFRKPEGGRMPCLVVGIIFLNLLLIYPRTGEPEFFKYVVENALRHGDDVSLFSGFENGEETSGLFGFLKSKVWTIGFAPFLLLFAFPLIGALQLLVQKRFVRFIFAALIFLSAIWMSLSAFLKYGGYNNNWMPLFMTLSVVCGLVYGHTVSALLKAENLKGFSLLIFGTVLIIGSQTFPHYYNPKEQIPTEDDHRAYQELIIYLQDKAEQNQSVWVLHHQWYGISTGHPMSYNSDMVRCATYADDWPADAYFRVIEDQTYDFVIMNEADINYEWLPVGALPRFQENYERFALLSDILDYSDDAMMPVTGAQTRPLVIYRRKTSF